MITVKRLAKKGEKILITNTKSGDVYSNGDILTVEYSSTDSDGETYAYTKETFTFPILEEEYEVIVADDMTSDTNVPEWAMFSSTADDVVCNLKLSQIPFKEEDPVENLLEDILYMIESNNEKMKYEHEEGYDYAYLRYLQGKDVALREVLDMIDDENAD